MGLYIGNLDKDKLPIGVTNEMLSQHKIYGVSFDGISHKGVRLYDAEGLRWEPSSEAKAGTDDFKSLYPFKIKKCVTQYDSTTSSRKVLAYEGDSNYDSLISAKTGDRMVEFTKGYYKRPNQWTFLVSPDYIEGFKPLPMFEHGGKVLDSFRISEYPIGSGYTSQPGRVPLTNVNIQGFRDGLRPKGQYLLDLAGYESVTMLAMIKYADLNSQYVNGYGCCSSNRVQTLGDSIQGDDGYRSSITANSNIRVMGIEDFYGNCWKLLDGAFEYAGYVYTNSDLANISAWPTMNNYTQNGWVKTQATVASGGRDTSFKQFANASDAQWIFSPTVAGGDSTDPIGDCFWSNNDSTMRCVVLGGCSWDGLSDGFLYWGSHNDVGYTRVYCGGLACEFS